MTKPTFKQYLVIEAGYHGWREPEATDFHVGKVVRAPQLKRGMLLGVKYHGDVQFYIEVLGFTGNDKKYGEGGVQYNSQKEMLGANNVTSLKALEELENKNEYGYYHYMKTRDLVSKEDGAWFYIHKGKWAVGSSADKVTFLEARYIPAKKDLRETPFTDKQEQHFLTTLRQDVKKTDMWPNPRKMHGMVKASSPKAKKIGSGAYSQAYGRKRSSVVIKLTHDGDGEDTLQFLKWAKQKKNPHLPKIYSIQKIKINQDEEYCSWTDDTNVYARMEKLIPLFPRKYNWKPEHVPFLEFMYLNDMGDRPEYVIGDKTWKKIKRQATRQRIYSSKLVQAMKMVMRFVDNDLDIILHRNMKALNLMVRPSTGEIVIHDPI